MIEATQLKDEFSKMSPGQLSDYKHLADFIYRNVGLALNCKALRIRRLRGCWGGLFMKQYPEEIAQLLVFLYKLKDQINSYCEIGVSYGGSFLVIDSFLRAINPNMGRSLGVDIRLRNKTVLTSYVKKYPQVEFLKTDTLLWECKEEFDFCFIDGQHFEENIDNDYNKMKDRTKILAIHDIKFWQAPAVQKVWNSIEGTKTELLNSDPLFPEPVGIGVVIK